MKIIIVDDEKHVRDAVKLLVKWEQFDIEDIFEAPEGLSAIEIIKKEQPEIILTDMMMPIIDGAALLEWIHQHAPLSKTIVISGHDDFSFMRHTIKYGGMDYILKPIDGNELNEALQKAVQSWKKEEDIRRQNINQSMQMNQIKPIYWDTLFSNLIQEPNLYPSIASELGTEFAITNDTSFIQVAVLSISTMPLFLENKYASNRDMLFFTLSNICNEFLREDAAGYAFRHWNIEHELVVVIWENLEHFTTYIEKINKGISQTLGCLFHFGIGTVKNFPLGLSDSYIEAQMSLKQRNLLHNEEKIHFYAHKKAPRTNNLLFNEHEEKIRLTLLSNHSGQIKAAIDDWFDDIARLDYITAEQLDLWWHDFTDFRTRCLEEFLPDIQPEDELRYVHPRQFVIPVDEQGHLSIEVWQAEFTDHMQHLAALLADQQGEHHVILEIAEYIQGHYSEDITLQHLSERYFISREYISRKFKQEMKENLSDYIGRLRIEKARLLLLNPKLRISQISDMIGYQDEKYFSKVFKKIVGISPSEYRKKKQL